VRDEEEFSSLAISREVREKALVGLVELRERFGGEDKDVE